MTSHRLRQIALVVPTHARPVAHEESVMPMASAADQANEEDEGGSAWPWIIAGGVVVAGAAVVAIILLQPSDEKVKFDEITVNW